MMADFDFKAYERSLTKMQDDELARLIDQIGRNGRTDLSDQLRAAVNSEIADRKRTGVTFTKEGIHHRV